MNGLDVTNLALDLWAEYRGDESTYMQCQRFDGWYWQAAWQGNENVTAYPSATDAANASAMFTTDVNDPAITPGDLLYWWWDPYGHICTAVGWDGNRLLVSNTARMGDTYLALRNGVKISHADTISLSFRGASHTNGSNAARTGIAAWPQASLGPQQRQVRSDNEARRRQGAPNTSAPQGDPLAANDVGNFQGWVTGESVEGNNLWYVGTSGDFFWSGSFTEVSTHDLPDLNKPSPSAGNQRQAGGDLVNQRKTPTTSDPTVTQIPAGEVRTFDAWKRGQQVEGNDVWFREGASQLWSWSGGFTDTGTHDLSDLNEVTPPTPGPVTRTVGDDSVNVRKTPYTSDVAITQLAAGSMVEVAGWTAGERVSNQGIWYKVPQGWAWSGGFTSQSTDGLQELSAPTPPSNDEINPIYKTFAPDSAVAKWVGSPNYNWYDPRPAGAIPTHVTMHWMDGTLAGTDAQFQKYSEVQNGVGDGSSSSYGVGQTEIHQYVREQDYQQADGDRNSNRWGLSIEHEGGTANPVTQAVMDLSAKLLVEIAKRYGWTEYVPFTDDVEAFRKKPDAEQLAYITNFAQANPKRRLVFPHKAWASTACPGTLDWQAIVAAANKQLAGDEPDPTPGGVTVTREFVEAQIKLWASLLT